MLHPGKVSLMIVEDDATIRYLLETAAHRSGLFAPVVSAADGQAALDRLRKTATGALPALVVSDLLMPNMTGLALLHEIKSDPRLHHIPVAIITSSNVPDDREQALAGGACSFIMKPIGLEALIQALVALRNSCVDVHAAAPSTA